MVRWANDARVGWHYSCSIRQNGSSQHYTPPLPRLVQGAHADQHCAEDSGTWCPGGVHPTWMHRPTPIDVGNNKAFKVKLWIELITGSGHKIPTSQSPAQLVPMILVELLQRKMQSHERRSRMHGARLDTPTLEWFPTRMVLCRWRHDCRGRSQWSPPSACVGQGQRYLRWRGGGMRLQDNNITRLGLWVAIVI